MIGPLKYLLCWYLTVEYLTCQSAASVLEARQFTHPRIGGVLLR